MAASSLASRARATFDDHGEPTIRYVRNLPTPREAAQRCHAAARRMSRGVKLSVCRQIRGR